MRRKRHLPPQDGGHTSSFGSERGREFPPPTKTFVWKTQRYATLELRHAEDEGEKVGSSLLPKTGERKVAHGRNAVFRRDQITFGRRWLRSGGGRGEGEKKIILAKCSWKSCSLSPSLWAVVFSSSFSSVLIIR